MYFNFHLQQKNKIRTISNKYCLSHNFNCKYSQSLPGWVVCYSIHGHGRWPLRVSVYISTCGQCSLYCDLSPQLGLMANRHSMGTNSTCIAWQWKFLGLIFVSIENVSYLHNFEAFFRFGIYWRNFDGWCRQTAKSTWITIQHG